MVFNGKSGSKYGLPFVMIARSCFGIRGSAIVGVLRSLLSILLYSLNLYTISYLLSIMLSTLSEGFRKIPNNFPADSNMDPQRAITFSIAWVINLLLAVFGQRVIRRTMLVKAVLFTLFIVGVVIWAAVKTSGPGPILQSGDEFLFVDYGDFFEKFFPAIASSMGVWFYMAINIADFTRYARSNGAQVIGQLTGLPLFATIFSIAGMSLVSMYLVSAAANPGEILNIAQLALMGKSKFIRIFTQPF
jgi:NCS1 family nucleobase:cation symporter-1